MKINIDWFHKINTYTTWPQMPMAHGPFGKDKISGAERKTLNGVPLFINVQTSNAIREAHRLGGRALSYLSFMDTYVHTSGFENGTARVPWDPRKPQILLINKDGCFVNTPMDGTRRMWRYLVCNNSIEYQDLALKMVRAQMEKGADGIFIDNSSARQPCYGHGFPVGYSEHYRSVVTAMPKWHDSALPENKLPEELYRLGARPLFRHLRYIRELPLHRHRYPQLSHDEAYLKLLRRVTGVVHSYGKGKIVIINGSLKHAHLVDGVMLESFMFSWTRPGPLITWSRVKARAAECLPVFSRGGRVLALSYLGNTKGNIFEDALYACSAAMLCGYLWSDYNTCQNAFGKKLRTLNIGRRLTPMQGEGDINHSFFENGLVIVNGTRRKHGFAVTIPRCFRPSILRNLLNGEKIINDSGKYNVMIPAYSGRIYVRPS